MIYEKQERNVLTPQGTSVVAKADIDIIETSAINEDVVSEPKQETAETITPAPKLPGLKVVGFIDPSQFKNKKKNRN